MEWEWEWGGTYPFAVAVLVLAVCFVDVCSVETDDCEGEHQLAEAEDCMCDVASGHLETVHDAHLAQILCWWEVW